MSAPGARAFLDVWRVFVGSFPAGWCHEEPGLLAFVTGTEIPTGNGVFVTADDVDPDRALALLDRIAEGGLGYGVQGRAPGVERVAGRAEEGRLRSAPGRPLMTLERDAADLGRFQGIETRQVGFDERELFVATAAEGFETPPAAFGQIFSTGAFDVPGLRAYVGEVEGRAVATACGVRVGDVVGVFAVGTVPAQRGKGYGAALTARAVEDGFAHGAELAVLQATDSGLPVYARMGFQTEDVWSVVVSA